VIRATPHPKCKDCGEEFWPHGLKTRYCKVCSDVRDRKKDEADKLRNKRTVKRPKIKGWKEKRAVVAQERFCGACACELPEGKSPAVDHIVPAAIVDELNRLNPEKKYDAEDERNLLPVCSKCHGKKRRSEIRLEKGDVLGYTQEVNRLGYPMDRVKAALRLYGLMKDPNFPKRLWKDGH